MKTATAQFRRVVDAILSGIKGVMVRVDDILVATSGGVSAHLEILKQVFSKLAKHNVRLSGPKCQFLKDKVKYMGHISGVPNGAARQNTRSTGQNSAGWEIEHWPHALAGKSLWMLRWLGIYVVTLVLARKKKCLASRVCFSPGNRTIKNISFF